MYLNNFIVLKSMIKCPKHMIPGNLKHTKMKILIALVSFCLCNVLSAQIKIGDNPQNIDASSVLELESSNRVLVITRINTQQMNSIVPLQGAVIYNTDEQCLFFYDGNAWLNLCSTLGLSFTADPIVNPTSTIVITENAGNSNFEVGEITGANIVDFSISGNDIQNNSITADKLAPDSVGSEELQDNTVADAEIDYNQVTLNDFNNDAGFITGAEIVSPDPGNSITDNGGAFYDNTPLQNDIAANAAAIAADGDTDAANEIQNLSLAGNNLTISGANTIDLGVFNNAGTDDQQLILAGNTLAIEDGNTVDLSVLNNPGTDDQNLTSATLNGANVLQINIENGASATVDLSALSGTGSDDQNLTGASLSPANVLQIDIEDGTSAIVDLSGLSGTGSDDQNLTGATLTGNILQIDIEDGTSATVDLSTLSGTGTDDQNMTGATLTGNILQIDIENGNPATVDLGALSGVDTDDQTLSLLGNQITIQDGNTIDLTPILGGGGSTELADQLTIVGSGAAGDEFEVNDGAINSTKITDGSIAPIDLANNAVQTAKILDANVTPVKIAPGTPGQFLTTNGGGNVAWANVPPADDNQVAAEVPFTPTGNTASIEVQAAIEELQIEIDGISGGGAANPNDELITSFNLIGTSLNIAEGANIVPPVDLDPVFVTDAELAALSVDDADADPTNEFNTGIALAGTSIQVTDLGGAVSQDLDGVFATDAELAALPVNDADADPINEIQNITSGDGSVTVTPAGIGFDLSVAAGSDDQNLTSATLAGSDLTIVIEDGTDAVADLSALATDVELAALPIDDADADPANEIQNITSGDGSVGITPAGIGFDLSVAAGSDDQNLTSATLAGSDLTIVIEDGTAVSNRGCMSLLDSVRCRLKIRLLPDALRRRWRAEWTAFRLRFEHRVGLEEQAMQKVALFCHVLLHHVQV